MKKIRDKNIIAGLRELDREELNILARKVGISKKSKYSYLLQKKEDIIEDILNNPKYEGSIGEFLNIFSEMKVSDEAWLREFAFELGIEALSEKREISKEKSKLVKKIIEKTPRKKLVKKATPKTLTAFIVGGTLATFIFSFMSELFSLFAGTVSIFAFLFVLITYAYPKFLLKETIALKRGEFVYRVFISTITGLLFIFTVFSYPDLKTFITDWGNITTVTGFLTGVIFFHFERIALIIWIKKHVNKLMWGIIVMMGLTLVYNEVFTIEVTANIEDDKILHGKTILNLKELTSDYFCGLLPESIDESLRLCEVKVEKKFFFRNFSLSLKKEDVDKIQILHDGKELNIAKKLISGELINKKLEFDFRYLLKGEWVCAINGYSICWKISQSAYESIKIEQKQSCGNNQCTKECIRGYCFNNKSFPIEKEKHNIYYISSPETSDPNYEWNKISIEIDPNDDNIVNVKFYENNNPKFENLKFERNNCE